MSGEFPYVDRDELLAMVIRVFSETGAEVGMTFLVGGQWVTGLTVSGRIWFENVADFADSRGAGVGVAFKLIGQRFYPSESEIEAGAAEEIPEDRPVHFLHLRAARRLGENGDWSPEEGAWLRIRLSQVDAWQFGNLMPANKSGAFEPLPPPQD